MLLIFCIRTTTTNDKVVSNAFWELCYIYKRPKSILHVLNYYSKIGKHFNFVAFDFLINFYESYIISMYFYIEFHD